ncbi:hypothetical protein DMUE_5005 [Dictyocoela muelleri]|nr:hypothetical protein DMUE_5005 [Dictyocoela muelleri]
MLYFILILTASKFYKIKKHRGEEQLRLYEKIKTDDNNYKFYKLENEIPKKHYINTHPALILQKMIIMHPIVYINGYKLTIIPFSRVYIEQNGILSLGIYERTAFKNNHVIQVFKGGSVCDLNKNKKWTTTIIFVLDGGEPRVDKIIERSLCSYDIVVFGNIFGDEIGISEIYYESDIPNKKLDFFDDEKEKEINEEEKGANEKEKEVNEKGGTKKISISIF